MIKAGDRVYVDNGGQPGNYFGTGTVTRVLENGWVEVAGDEPFGAEEGYAGEPRFEFEPDRLTVLTDDEPQAESEELTDLRKAVAEYHAATQTTRHPNSARFHALLEEAAGLHDSKQADYGSDADPFANVRASTDWGIPAWVGTMVRLNDKVKRLQSLAQKGELVNEAAVDSFMDIAVYALIARVLYEEQA